MFLVLVVVSMTGVLVNGFLTATPHSPLLASALTVRTSIIPPSQPPTFCLTTKTCRPQTQQQHRWNQLASTAAPTAGDGGAMEAKKGIWGKVSLIVTVGDAYR
jgi:hypothetical protein